MPLVPGNTPPGCSIFRPSVQAVVISRMFPAAYGPEERTVRKTVAFGIRVGRQGTILASVVHIPLQFLPMPLRGHGDVVRTARGGHTVAFFRRGGFSMKTTTFRTQYRKFRLLTARFFRYWFFVIFATLGVAIAVMERFTNVLGVQHLEPLMILILAYATLVYIVTERAKVLDDIHENLRSAKAEVYPTRESVYMAVPLLTARASAATPGRRRIFHAALHGLGGEPRGGAG